MKKLVLLSAAFLTTISLLTACGEKGTGNATDDATKCATPCATEEACGTTKAVADSTQK